MYSQYSTQTIKPRTREHYLIEVLECTSFNNSHNGYATVKLTDGTEHTFSTKVQSSHVYYHDSEGLPQAKPNGQYNNVMECAKCYFSKQPVKIWVTQNGYMSELFYEVNHTDRT